MIMGQDGSRRHSSTSLWAHSTSSHSKLNCIRIKHQVELRLPLFGVPKALFDAKDLVCTHGACQASKQEVSGRNSLHVKPGDVE